MPLRHFTLLTTLSAAALFWNLGAPSLHHAEGDWATIVFNMFDHGRIFILQIGHFDYYDKPFLSYWLMLICAKVAGEVSEAALRFPSALAGLASVLMTYAFARRFFGPRVALNAGLVLLSTSGFIIWGRIAQSEMLNLLGILAPLWLFFCWRDSSRPAWLYTMTLIMAVGSWTKGPLCFVVPGFVIVLYSLLFRDWKWLKGLHVVAAGTLSVILYFSIFLLAWLDTGRWDALFLVYRENVLRLFSPWDHVRPFYYYFYAVPAILAPWSVLLPWVVIHLVKTRKSLSPELKILLLIMAGIWVFFALSGSRRSYYLIPLLPFAAMWVAVWLEALTGLPERSKKSIRTLWFVAGILALVPLTARIGLPRSFMIQVAARYLSGPAAEERVVSALTSFPVTLAYIALAVVGVSWLYLSWTRFSDAGIRIFVSGVCAVLILYFGLVSPKFAELRGYREFVKEVAAVVTRGEEMTLYPQQEAAMVFYLQVHQGMRSYRLFDDLAAARDHLLQTGGVLLAEEREPLPQESWEKIVDEHKLRVTARTDSEQYAWGLYRPRAPVKPPS
ncbi:MAG: hypothetical protein EHM61_12790 [Acidobacteria bacterium]|nr:MAG: hypothetical protein EHM61_12790 [Acidobacteriota bacterium]